MTTTITFNQLRKIKDNLPDGSIHAIAEELNLDVDVVLNYFGGHHYDRGKSVGFHIEPGPDGGIVELDDTTILQMAQDIIEGRKVLQ